MVRHFRSSLRNRLLNQRRRRSAARPAARREVFRAFGWEQLERRTLLTAATLTWTGAVDANWSTPGNWDLDRAPINGDSLVFPVGGNAQRMANNNDIAGLSVNSITFQGFLGGSGYILSGDDLTVGSGGIVDDSTSVRVVAFDAATPAAAQDPPSEPENQFDCNLTLSAAQSWANDDIFYGHLLAINGNVDNGGFALTATGNGGIIDVAGQISGSGSLSTVLGGAQGAGVTLELQNSNTYTGETSVENETTLIVNGSTAQASPVSITGGTLGGSGTVGGHITIVTPNVAGLRAPGTIDPGSGSNLAETIGTLSNTGGVSVLLAPDAAIATPADNSNAIQFAVQLGGSAANPINDQLNSAGTVSLADTSLDLTQVAVDAGPFNAGQQFVIVQAAAPITTPFIGLPEGATVSDGVQNFIISYANDRVTLTALATGTLTWTGNSSSSNNWSDPANWNLDRAPIDGDSLIFPAGASRLASHDDIAGLSVSSITFNGTFATFTSGYNLSGNTLSVGGGGIVDNALFVQPLQQQTIEPSEPVIVIGLNLALSAAQSWSASQLPLMMNGNVANGGFDLTAIGNGTLDFDGTISGGGGLVLAGNGTGSAPTVVLANANDYTGATSVQIGTLIVDGSTATASAVTVAAGATLGGAGTVGGEITIIGPGGLRAQEGGTLDPGDAPDPSKDAATLSNTGGVTFQPSAIVEPGAASDAERLSQFAVQLGGTASNPTNDQLSSAGTVAFVDATFLNLTTLAGAGPYHAGQQFVIVQAGAPITTTFIGLPEGSTVSDGTQNFTISYANDRVTLTAQPVAGTASTYLNGQPGDMTAATFIHNLYRELLGREPDAAGQTFWLNVFVQADAGGTTAAAAQQKVVAGFLGSTEYREHLVGHIYTDFLHRAADDNDLAFWNREMAAGLDEKVLLAYIVGSYEYYAENQPQLPELIAVTPKMAASAWVDALYRDLLGRTPDAGGLDYWTQQVLSNNTPSGRAAIAFEFLGAGEVDHKLLNGNYPGAAGSVGAPGTPAEGAYALADITGNGWDNLYFQGSLSVAAVDSLFASLQAGASFDATIATMLDLPQYLNGAVVPI